MLQALDRGATLLGAHKVATGHNADDVAETVLLNILRGDVPRWEGGEAKRCQSRAPGLVLTHLGSRLGCAHVRKACVLMQLSSSWRWAPGNVRTHPAVPNTSHSCRFPVQAGPLCRHCDWRGIAAATRQALQVGCSGWEVVNAGALAVVQTGCPSSVSALRVTAASRRHGAGTHMRRRL